MLYRHCLEKLKNTLELMYNMKSRVVFWVLSVLLVVMTGCDNNQSTQPNLNESNVEMLSDTIKQQLVKQDSLSKDLLHQVDTLTTELNSAKAEIEQLKISVEQKENQGLLWTILPTIIGCLALIIAIIVGFCTRHKVEEKDVESILEKRFLSYIKVYESRKADNQILNDNKKNRSLEERIKKLEDKVEGMKPIVPLPIPKKTNEHHNVEKPISKHLYACINSKEYFTNVLETKQETCVYIIDLISATTGEFGIISIEKIKQRNGWDSVIEYTGDCTIHDAKSFKTNEPGRCEKLSDGTWKVVKKLRITISK